MIISRGFSSLVYTALIYVPIYCRMYHIDDVPSGAGEGTIDYRRAMSVCYLLLCFYLNFQSLNDLDI